MGYIYIIKAVLIFYNIIKICDDVSMRKRCLKCLIYDMGQYWDDRINSFMPLELSKFNEIFFPNANRKFDLNQD